MTKQRQGSLAHLKAALVAVLVFYAVTMLVGCGGSGGTGGGGGATSAATGADFQRPASLTMPAASAAGASIDTDHVNEGYVVAHASDASRLKFQVAKGDEVYNYDLPNNDSATVFPVNMGNGGYLFRIMKNTEGNNYIELDSANAEVSLSSEFVPFLIPNQFCEYNESSACVSKANELTSSVSNQGEAVQVICEFVINHVSYDTDKARELSSKTGYIPNPDQTLSSGKGVCFDYASLGAAMLRSQGIPTKVITGYVSPGDLYHSWVMVYIDGTWKTALFAVSSNTWSRVDLTFASSGGNEFTGDGTSYVDRYVY